MGRIIDFKNIYRRMEYFAFKQISNSDTLKKLLTLNYLEIIYLRFTEKHQEAERLINSISPYFYGLKNEISARILLQKGRIIRNQGYCMML